VGLASYLLIGFWYHKPSANARASRRSSSTASAISASASAIFGTFLVFGTVFNPGHPGAAPAHGGSTFGFLGLRVDVMTTLCPAAVRRRDGQVGAARPPTPGCRTRWKGRRPVSALIHAATMVTAGVFMVCRLSPMFEQSDTALAVVTLVGAATAYLRGDRRHRAERHQARDRLFDLLPARLHVFAAGVGAYSAAMFHLFTHAFFKALLFLAPAR
jgi:NADH-quinone oxidoreductase subunit L